MSSREEFEAWYLENWGHTEDEHETLFERDPDDEYGYYRLGVRMAHQAWQAATKAMEAKCAALAAELNVVEAIHNDAVFITDDHYEQCPPEVQKIIRSLAVMQIPSYKEFLAEVRAQGVDMFALMFAEEAIKTNNITTGWRAKASRAAFEYAEALREDAAQLRKGVHS